MTPRPAPPASAPEQPVPPARGGRGRVLRWSAVVLVLLVAAAVALWPRDEPAERRTARPAPDLAQLRAAADLAPCPGAPTDGGATGGGATDGAVPESAAADDGGAAAAGVPSGTALDAVTVTCLATGAAMPLGAAVAGADTLVNVWAHTCEPCRDELPALQEYALRPDAARVVALQVDGSPEAGLAMLTALGVRLPSVHDVNDAARAALGAPPVLPLSYVVSGGQVRLVNPPVVFRDADEVAATVARYRGAA